MTGPITTTRPIPEQLLVALRNRDDEAAERAVQGLTPTDEPALLSWLNAIDSDQRWWGARALAQCGGPAAVQALQTCLTDDDPTLRSVAAFAIGHLYARAPAAVEAALPEVAARLGDEDGAVRQVAADALTLCGDGAVPVLEKVLQGQHEGARTRAAYALRKIATPATIPVLFRSLNDTNYMVHTYAFEALDELGLLENVLVTRS
jgi:HEAT repeat protein